MYARLSRSHLRNAPTGCLRSVWLRGRTGREPLAVDVFADEGAARAAAGPADEVWEVLDVAGRLDGAAALVQRLESDAIGSVLETAVDYARAEAGNTGALALVDREAGRGVVVTLWETARRAWPPGARRYEVVVSSERPAATGRS